MKRNISKYFFIVLTFSVTSQTLEATHTQEIEINQWVSRVTVGPLPEGCSTVEIVLPECNTVRVNSVEGGTFSLATRINPHAEIFHYDHYRDQTRPFLETKFNYLAGPYWQDIFDGMPEEPGVFRLEITFDKYNPKGRKPTISFVKDH